MSRDRGVLEGGVDWPRVLLAVLAVCVVVALGIVATTSTSAFAPYNPSWDGTSDFRGQLESDSGVEYTLVRETTRYDDVEANGTVAFVVAPEEGYEGEDATRVRQFVEGGGTLVVLENFGSEGNELVADVGAEARTDGQLLRDDRHNARGPNMPIATGIAEDRRTAGVDQLTLNHASALEPGNATVLVTTSEFAYRSEDGEGSVADSEELAAHPVATTEAVGDGDVIVVGDPSIAINVMYDEPDNAVFLHNLHADADRVLVDLSHGGDVPPAASAVLLIRELPHLQLLIGVASVVLLAGRVDRRLRRGLEFVRGWGPRSGSEADRSPRLSDADRVAFLRSRHPEWDDRRIRRIATAVDSREDSSDEPTKAGTTRERRPTETDRERDSRAAD